MNEKKNLKKAVSYKWLKLSFIKGARAPKLFWILPKKYIPLAVTRNRLKRWGRLFFQKEFLEWGIEQEKSKKEDEIKFMEGDWLIFMQKQNKNFYKSLRKKDFEAVLKTAFEALLLKIQNQEAFQKQRGNDEEKIR